MGGEDNKLHQPSFQAFYKVLCSVNET